MRYNNMEHEIKTRDIALVFEYLGHRYRKNEPLEVIKNLPHNKQTDKGYVADSYEFYKWLTNDEYFNEKMKNLGCDKIPHVRFFQRVISWKIDCDIKEKEKEIKEMRQWYDDINDMPDYLKVYEGC